MIVSSKKKLELLEKKYGGLTRNIKINKNSEYDPNITSMKGCFYTGSENNITNLQCGGDRMSSSQMAYGEIYERIIDKLTNVKSVVEIGILTGIGIAIWSDIFPKAEVYGFDIDLSHFLENKHNLINKGAFKNNNISVYEFDQYNPNISLLSNITKLHKINLIIDDGCHEDTAIIITFNKLYPCLDDDFVYIIEDNSKVYIEIKNKYPDIILTNIDQFTVITKKHRTDIHLCLENIHKLNSTKHAVYFTPKKQIISHSTNNYYGNILLDKYNVSDTIELLKEGEILKFHIIKKELKLNKLILDFNDELTDTLIENRRNWIINFPNI